MLTSSQPSLLARAALGAASIVVALAVLEAATRWMQLTLPDFGSPAPFAIVLHYDDPNGLVQLTPNWQGFVSGAWTTINAEGFRDRLYARRAAPGTVRIGVLGDSYTMGDGVALSSTYPKQLESLLQADGAFEVMNFGTSATNTVQQSAALPRILADYTPQIVVVGFNVNDFQLYKQTRFERLAEAGVALSVLADGRVAIKAENLGRGRRLRLWIRDRSHLYRYLAELREAWRAPPGPDRRSMVDQWIENGGRQRAFAALEEMQRQASQAGATFVVAVLPDLIDGPSIFPSMAEYPFTHLHDEVCAFLRSRRIACVDTLPDFAGRDPRRLVVHRLDRHFNHDGLAIIARALERALRPIVQGRGLASGVPARDSTQPGSNSR